MGLLDSLKGVLGSSADEHTYECSDCGETFDSYIDPDDHWVTCDHCDSRQVELIEQGS
ncbi:MAG: hypothetical protein ABEI76_07060 [Halobacteriales archaeon]